MKQRTYTNQQLIDAIKDSFSIRNVLKLLNLKPAGGNYKSIYSKIEELNLDTSHFTGSLWSKGRTLPLKRSIEDYLNNNQPIQSFKLKNRLLRENILKHICSTCGIKDWLGYPAPLELDHIDGNPSNNSLINLRLLCPNCHSQTPTYRGKNKKQ